MEVGTRDGQSDEDPIAIRQLRQGRQPGKGGKGREGKGGCRAPARVQEPRAQTARAERRSKAIRIGGIAAVGAIGIAIIAVAALSGGHDPAAAQPAGSGELPRPPVAAGVGMTPGPFPRIRVTLGEQAGLRALNTEGEALHFHPHLDVIVNGKPVTVPADIGIDETGGRLSELHTHNTSGVLHVEAPDTDRRYVLGQLFAEWNVRLDAAHLGGLTAGDGKLSDGLCRRPRRSVAIPGRLSCSRTARSPWCSARQTST